MISCTEFIPLYSEFFKYLESRDGHDAVVKYWHHISDTSLGDKTNPNSMAYHCERLGGFDGARAYWRHTTTEEACDVFSILDKKNRFSYSHMRYCPSKGMLNAMEHVEPYYDYCEHCKVLYSRVLEKYGVVYERDHSKVANAECTSLLYEAGNRPDIDFANLTKEQVEELKQREGVVVGDLKREGKKYLHRDFHLLGDQALKYCADQYGEEGLQDFLAVFTKGYYSPQIEQFRKEGLPALKAWIEKIYEIEESSEVLHTELTDNTLTVKIDRCPVIEYMHTLNQEPTPYYIEETRTLYRIIAEESGFSFVLEYYKEDGAAKFTFTA